MANKIIAVEAFAHQLTTVVNGKTINIKEVSSLAGYDGITVYSKVAAKGVNKGQLIYAVSTEDYKAPSRKTLKQVTSDKIATLKAQGLSAEQIIAALEK